MYLMFATNGPVLDTWHFCETSTKNDALTVTEMARDSLKRRSWLSI